jgi:hypothetical protein
MARAAKKTVNTVQQQRTEHKELGTTKPERKTRLKDTVETRLVLLD